MSKDKQVPVRIDLTSEVNGVCLRIDGVVIAPQQVISGDGALRTFLIRPEKLYKRLPESVKLEGRTEKMCYVLDYRAIPDEGSILCRLSCDHEVLIPDLGPFNPSIEYCPYCAAKVMSNDNRHD